MLGRCRAMQVQLDRVSPRVATAIDAHGRGALVGVLRHIGRTLSRHPGRRRQGMARTQDPLDEAGDQQIARHYRVQNVAAPAQSRPPAPGLRSLMGLMSCSYLAAFSGLI